MQAFPGCVLGVSHIGYVMITFGITGAIASILAGRKEKICGRKFLFVFAKLLNVGSICVMATWNPEHGPDVVMYLLPAGWALADAIWQVSIMSKCYRFISVPEK